MQRKGTFASQQTSNPLPFAEERLHRWNRQTGPFQRKKPRRKRQGLCETWRLSIHEPKRIANSWTYFSLFNAATRSSGVRLGASFSAVPPAEEIFSSADLLKR